MVAQKVGYFMETEEKKIYTIEDIARELGVSKTTVSRAISGKGRISQATRDRVRAFIKEHDYRPNVVAKGLAQRKTYNIALLMPKDYVATEFLFFKDCMNGICEMASSYDYDIIISMIDGADVSQIQRLALSSGSSSRICRVSDVIICKLACIRRSCFPNMIFTLLR